MSSLRTHHKTPENSSEASRFVSLINVSDPGNAAASIAGCTQRTSQRNVGHTSLSRLQDLDGPGFIPMTTFHAAGTIVLAAAVRTSTTGAVAAAVRVLAIVAVAARVPATVAAGVRHQ